MGLLDILELGTELVGLARDVYRAEREGKPVRVDDILPEELSISLTKKVKDARARLKYG